jgi:hypothetical protein
MAQSDVQYSHPFHTRQGCDSEFFPSAQVQPNFVRTRHLPVSTNNLLASALMSHSHPTSSSSNNNYQLVINNALKAYEKRTNNDLLSHPLATQLQNCNSPGDILTVLHEQVQGQDQSRSIDDRWTRWLDPTINVLYTLSETLGEGVSLVSHRT